MGVGLLRQGFGEGDVKVDAFLFFFACRRRERCGYLIRQAKTRQLRIAQFHRFGKKNPGCFARFQEVYLVEARYRRTQPFQQLMVRGKSRMERSASRPRIYSHAIVRCSVALNTLDDQSDRVSLRR